MFCATLRKRKDWASASNALLRAQWRETKLDAYDAAFPVPGRGESEVIFHVLLLSASDGTQDHTKERIERLSLANGGAHVAVIMLLEADHAMVTFGHLQMEMLAHGHQIPIIPITSTADLVPCLVKLRNQCSGKDSSTGQSAARQRDLLSHCLKGQPLSQRSTNMLLDLSSGFKSLTGQVFDPQCQQQMHDLLGDEGARLISFLREGPSASRV